MKPSGRSFRRAKSEGYLYAKIPIILFTAKAQEEDQKLCEEMGADAYLTKPFDSKTFLEKIRELIGS